MSIIALIGSSGCSTIAKVVMQYPDEYDSNVALIDKTLKAFAGTIIKGAPENDPNLIRAFSDPYYPFLKYRGFFIHCLTKMGQKEYGNIKFYELDEEQRRNVIAKVIHSKGRKRQLFKAAIALVQISHYAGIYDDKNGCKLIDFRGQNYGHRPEAMFYPDNYKYMSTPLTATGNYS
jgi:hypothetical protein